MAGPLPFHIYPRVMVVEDNAILALVSSFVLSICMRMYDTYTQYARQDVSITILQLGR